MTGDNRSASMLTFPNFGESIQTLIRNRHITKSLEFLFEGYVAASHFVLKTRNPSKHPLPL